MTALVDYLAALGISHVYLSPIFTARPGSPHGYDVLDPTTINPELGGEEGLRALADRLHEHGMGLILDVVPNHMCVIGGENRFWMDILENGPSSPCARYFDIDWNPPKADLAQKVLLPVLGEQYGKELERGAIRVLREGGGFVVEYGSLRFPLAPKTWPGVLEPALAELRATLPEDDDQRVELESILTAIRHLPSRGSLDSDQVQERVREKGVVRRRLATLVEESRAVRDALDAALITLNGKPGDAGSFATLEALLADQAYRLSHWQVASDEINYRRFFDVNELAAVRVEDEEVFAEVHGLPARLVSEGIVDGLRVDHADGLYDPSGYLAKLADIPYVVVEKILEDSERLPADWPVAGTTGYEFMKRLDGLFVDPAARDAFRDIYRRFTGTRREFVDVVYESKKLTLRAMLSSELTVLARRLDRISEQHRYSRDFTLRSMEDALSEILACFPVYRTYVRPQDDAPVAADCKHIIEAGDEARRRNPAISDSLFSFVLDVLLLRHPDGLDESQVAERRDFVLRFQQLTGPVMAKGLEDTASYRYFPLASLAEVGGDAGGWGAGVDEFHSFCEERSRRWPLGMSATSTHDTKRDEDVRARISVLSEVPAAWEEAIRAFRLQNRGRHQDLPGEAPDANDEYLLYQTLVGTWPAVTDGAAQSPEYVSRIRAYLVKTGREAKVHTSWISPNATYEAAVHDFIGRILTEPDAAPFRREINDFVETILPAGLLNAVAGTLLKIAAPGIPDFYQGTERPEFLLVDPDNRRPVDFMRRRAMLNTLPDTSTDVPGEFSRFGESLADGRLKMLVTSRGCRLRRERTELFVHGSYEPLKAVGPHADRIVGCVRRLEQDSVMAVTGRLLAGMPFPPIGAEAWGGTHLELPAGAGERFRDVLSGRSLRVRDVAGTPGLPLDELFAHAPFALLERDEIDAGTPEGGPREVDR